MKNRGGKGSGLIEALAMGIVLLLVALAMIDFVIVVLANSVNDTAAKSAARAAANQPDGKTAVDAANKALETMKPSGFISSLTLQDLFYTKNDTVSCKTSMEIKLPIPLPGVGGTLMFMAQDTEPIVVTSR